jgi:hypothetical protein
LMEMFCFSEWIFCQWGRRTGGTNEGHLLFVVNNSTHSKVNNFHNKRIINKKILCFHVSTDSGNFELVRGSPLFKYSI